MLNQKNNIYLNKGEIINFSDVNKRAWEYKSYEYWVQKYGEPYELGENIATQPNVYLKKYLSCFENFLDASVLNICGSYGKLAVACACKGAKVTVVDISIDGKRFADEMAKGAHVELSYVNSDFMEFESQEKYNVAFSYIGVIHYFSDIQMFFEKTYSMIEDGGYLILSDFHPFLKVLFSEKERSDGDYFDSSPFYGDMPYASFFDDEDYPKCVYREYTISEIINALIKSKFEIEHFAEIPFNKEKYPCEFIVKARKRRR